MIRRFFNRRTSPKTGAGTYRALRSVFSKFQAILDANTKVLAQMAQMEQSLGGEFIFDRAYLNQATREICTLVHQVVYSLNALCDHRFIELYDRFQEIKSALEEILAGGLGPQARRPTLPLSAIRLESQPLVGYLNAHLGEIRQQLGPLVPDGFAVTLTGWQLFSQPPAIVGERASGDGNLVPPPPDGTPPSTLRRAVAEELRALAERTGGPLAVQVTAEVLVEGAESSSREYSVGPIPGRPDEVLAALAQAWGHAGAPATGASPEQGNGPHAVRAHATVQVRVAPRLVGRAVTLDPDEPSQDLMMIQVALAEDETEGFESGDTYWLGRAYPHDQVMSRITPRPRSTILADGTQGLTVVESGLARGSGLMTPTGLAVLAQIAMMVERLLGQAQDIRFAEEAGTGLRVLNSRPMAGRTEAVYPAEAIRRERESAEVLLEGGETAQLGAAAGRVHLLGEDEDPESFPLGAVAVARAAAPRLSSILRRAAALITDVGTATGHLAAMAREFRVPAIFGTGTATSRLRTGMEVTVDTEAGKVYRGILPVLATMSGPGSELTPADPEFLVLRLLLRRISPLNLLDPLAANFTPQGCHTCHDLIHFAHEKAVEELLALPRRHRGWRGIKTCRLEMDVPLDLRILDIGGGLTPGPGTRVGPSEVRSRPLRAFLMGLAQPGLWQRAPTGLTLRDIFSSLNRTWDKGAEAEELATGNLAIAAERYVNLSLRLGYHFSVLDAYLSENPNKNAIYFRFVGGLADEVRRRRRARLIGNILESLDFKVDIQGDLVVGRLKIVDRATMESTLAVLGRLTAFTRQLDVDLTSDEQIPNLIERFIDRRTGLEPSSSPDPRN